MSKSYFFPEFKEFISFFFFFFSSFRLSYFLNCSRPFFVSAPWRGHLAAASSIFNWKQPSRRCTDIGRASRNYSEMIIKQKTTNRIETLYKSWLDGHLLESSSKYTHLRDRCWIFGLTHRSQLWHEMGFSLFPLLTF